MQFEGAFHQISQQPEILEVILDECHPKQLVKLQRCSKSLYRAICLYYTRVMRLRLREYFEDVDSFLYVMACTSSVLSGSWILKTLLRKHVPRVYMPPDLKPWERCASQSWEGNDLDIYVKPGTTITKVFDVFMYAQGYRREALSMEPEDRWRRVYGDEPLPDDADLTEFLSYQDIDIENQTTAISEVVQYTNGKAHVDIIVSKEKYAVTPIRHFHSTVVMNYAYYDRLICMFPEYTFKEINILNASGVTVPMARGKWCVRKYELRGFQLHKQLKIECTKTEVRWPSSRCEFNLLHDMGSLLYSNFAMGGEPFQDMFFISQTNMYRKYILSIIHIMEKTVHHEKSPWLWSESNLQLREYVLGVRTDWWWHSNPPDDQLERELKLRLQY